MPHITSSPQIYYSSMDEILLQLEIDSPDIYQKYKNIADLCEELFKDSSDLSVKFLQFLLKKYSRRLFSDNLNKASQTENSQETADTDSWSPENIASEVAAVANENVKKNDFIYDEASGLYYNHYHQCYYHPEYKLYYYTETGAYYYYDMESKDLKYYCSAYAENHNAEAFNNGFSSSQLEITTKNTCYSSTSNINSSISVSESKFSKTKESNESDDEREEGECSDSDETDENLTGPIIIEAPPKAFVPNHAEHIAPCIRALVKSSSVTNLDAGTLFIVTCTGGTMGREGNHDILIPDKAVSKLHSTFRYVYKDGSYFFEIIDMGSRNGTFLDGIRLSDSLTQSTPYKVNHGSIISVGGIDLLCHIHKRDETCLDCQEFSVKEDKRDSLSLKEKFCNENLAIRKKYCILNPSVPKYPSGYEDKSEIRRKTVGSSHDSEKTQAASVDVAVDKTNKGFALMSKMGWIEGSALGKNDCGITEPITVKMNEGKCGIGCEVPKQLETSKETKKMAIARKTCERYHKIV